MLPSFPAIIKRHTLANSVALWASGSPSPSPSPGLFEQLEDRVEPLIVSRAESAASLFSRRRRQDCTADWHVGFDINSRGHRESAACGISVECAAMQHAPWGRGQTPEYDMHASAHHVLAEALPVNGRRDFGGGHGRVSGPLIAHMLQGAGGRVPRTAGPPRVGAMRGSIGLAVATGPQHRPPAIAPHAADDLALVGQENSLDGPAPESNTKVARKRPSNLNMCAHWPSGYAGCARSLGLNCSPLSLEWQHV